jgi:hypothetical protein
VPTRRLAYSGCGEVHSIVHLQVKEIERLYSIGCDLLPAKQAIAHVSIIAVLAES